MMPTFITNWHHRVLADRLTKLRHQKRQRIMIFLQPQVGKSLLVSRMFPAWWLGHSPWAKIISSSYALSLSESFNVDCQEILQSEAYAEVFKTRLADKAGSKKRTQSFFQLDKYPGYNYSVGVGGATIGKSADIFLIDDPVKGPKEAFSASQRRSTIEWYNSVAETRVSMDGHIILMHQRWHKNDLAGYLLETMAETGEDWDVLYFPAVCKEPKHVDDPREIGEPLWPEFKGDAELWEKMEKKAGPYFWNSIYQQDPTGISAALVKPENFQYYDPAEQSFAGMEQSHSWDMNFKSAEEQAKGSYVVGQHWATDGHNFYLIGQKRGKWGFEKTHQNFADLYNKFPVSQIYIEDKANGPAIIDSFRNILPCELIPVEPRGDKFGRFAAVTPLITAGRVFLPDPDKVQLDNEGLNWVKDFLTEVTDFPNGENDDQVDSMSQYLSKKWDPESEGVFSIYSPTSASKWGGISRPKS